MPNGKPDGVRCVQLGKDHRCLIFGQPERPEVCSSLQPSGEMCGENREQAMFWLGRLEAMTASERQRRTPGGGGMRSLRN